MPTLTQHKALIALLLLGGSCAACFGGAGFREAVPAFGDWPTRRVVDTRRVQAVDWAAIGPELALGVVEAFPNEFGSCLYGELRDTVVFVEAMRADSISPGPNRVQLWCSYDLKIDDYPIIGDVHSHPGFVYPDAPCTLSGMDFESFYFRPELAISMVLCGNGFGVVVLRDGRHWGFRWVRLEPGGENG